MGDLCSLGQSNACEVCKLRCGARASGSCCRRPWSSNYTLLLLETSSQSASLAKVLVAAVSLLLGSFAAC